ncbi:hypothetical protein Gotur_024017 [Gossypium turneri]
MATIHSMSLALELLEMERRMILRGLSVHGMLLAIHQLRHQPFLYLKGRRFCCNL